jgi:hypothetical protein
MVARDRLYLAEKVQNNIKATVRGGLSLGRTYKGRLFGRLTNHLASRSEQGVGLH